LPWLYLFINGVPSCSSSFIDPKAQIYNLTSNLTEKWKLHTPPLIPNLIAGYYPASQEVKLFTD
jgi:hypothetical protein